jgi:DNA-binding protein HU-beta
MTKADIIDEVATATGLTKVETEAVLEGLIQSVINSLSHGERVDIRGFGSFIVKKKSARDAHNPATREVVKLKERFVPSFKVSKLLKDRVNKALLRGF